MVEIVLAITSILIVPEIKQVLDTIYYEYRQGECKIRLLVK